MEARTIPAMRAANLMLLQRDTAKIPLALCTRQERAAGTNVLSLCQSFGKQTSMKLASHPQSWHLPTSEFAVAASTSIPLPSQSLSPHLKSGLVSLHHLSVRSWCLLQSTPHIGQLKTDLRILKIKETVSGKTYIS